MNAPRLVLIRHGEMTGDPFARPQRPVRGCLSDDGILQARAITAALGRRTWRRIFASPYGRALQTAEIVFGEGADITILDELHEWTPNPKLEHAPSTVWEDMWKRYAEAPPDDSWATEAGEGTFEMYHRIIPAVIRALHTQGWHARYGGFVLDPDAVTGDIAMVAHGGSLNTLLSYLLGLRPSPISSFSFELCGVADIRLSRHADLWHPQLVIPTMGVV